MNTRQRKDVAEFDDEVSIGSGYNYARPHLEEIKNPDPKMYYYQATPDQVEQLKAIGYQVDEAHPSRLAGHITMSLPLEERKARERHELYLSRLKESAALKPSNPNLISSGGITQTTRQR
jgi:hypothetical protein